MLTDVYKDNVARFPDDRFDADADVAGDRAGLNLSRPLPLGLCILIWAVLASAGWGLVYVAVHLIFGGATAL
jgi:hypothetical protein